MITLLGQHQRFDPLSTNKRKTPDIEGYSLRKIKMCQEKPWILQFLNQHEDYRVDFEIDLKKDLLSIPKITTDCVKFQKEAKTVTKQLQNEIKN